MIEHPDVVESVVVSCAVCQKEVPRDVALSSESQDYIRYFCGPACLEEWSDDEQAVRMQEAGDA